MTAADAQELIALMATYAGKLLNSAFALSFVGALAGAAAGGLARRNASSRNTNYAMSYSRRFAILTQR